MTKDERAGFTAVTVRLQALSSVLEQLPTEHDMGTDQETALRSQVQDEIKALLERGPATTVFGAEEVAEVAQRLRALVALQVLPRSLREELEAIVGLINGKATPEGAIPVPTRVTTAIDVLKNMTQRRNIPDMVASEIRSVIRVLEGV